MSAQIPPTKFFYPIMRPSLPPNIKLEENVYVTMRDGIELAVDIYRPKAEGTYPAILSMAPYQKERQQFPARWYITEAGNTAFFVPKGYVHVIAQTRGSGFSQGRYNLFDIREQQDGYDVVEWIAKQSWCNGNVGMMGESYGAMIQYLVAAQQPPHLKAIVPYDGMTDIYRDAIFQGGLYHDGFMNFWGTWAISQCLWPGPIEGKLQPANLYAEWFSRPEDGPYYWKRSAWTKLDKIKAAVYMIARAHNPLHSRGQLDAYDKINAPKKLLVVNTGPVMFGGWVLFHYSTPLNEQILRWFDYWLKSIDTGIMKEPPIAIFDDGAGEWRYENEYPSSRTVWKNFYLHSNPAGGPAGEPPYGLLTQETPKDEKPDEYDIPESRSLVDAGKPVLAYTTPPLTEYLQATGPVSMVLYGSSTTVDTAWIVKMAGMAIDGKVAPLSKGWLRASYREIDVARSKPGQPFHPYRNPTLLEPGKAYEFQIEMLPVFHTFKAGYRILVQIASDDNSIIEALNSHTLHTIYAEILPVPAKNRVYHDSAHPSHLMLPIIPKAPVSKPVAPPISQIKWPPF